MRAGVAGFSEEKDSAGYKALRRGLKMEQLVSLGGDESAQAGWLLGEIAPIFAV